MSPTRRQLLAGIASLVTTGAVAGGIASSDLSSAHAHQHSIGRYETFADHQAAQEARAAFDSLDDLILFALIPNPHRERDGCRRIAVTLHVEHGQLKVSCPGDPQFDPQGIDFTANLSDIPDWMAQPIGEFMLKWEAAS